MISSLTLTAINDAAFYECEYLSNVEMSENITHIGNSAFAECENLNSIFIPSSVKEIGTYAFCNFSESSHVFYEGTEERWNEISIGSSNWGFSSAKRHHKVKKEEIELKETVSPTCTEFGYSVFKCTLCESQVNKNLTEELGHDLVDAVLRFLSREALRKKH